MSVEIQVSRNADDSLSVTKVGKSIVENVMPDASADITQFDPDLWQAMEAERHRQEEHIELIASENYTSPRVLAAQGSILTNKYAEGYPGKRYYGGCEHVDVVEKLALDRAKELFGATYANVQPHSGSQANAAVYMALLNAGDTVLGMSLDAGGHLTHGASVNFSGRLYNSVSYGVNDDDGLINYEKVAQLAHEHKPEMIMAGFSAYSRVVDWQKFRSIADEIDAYLVVDMAHVAGLVAVGLYPSPIDIADVTTTTTHKTLCGPRGGMILTGSRADKALHKKLNSAIFPGLQGGPLMHVVAAKAICFKEAMMPPFAEYQKQVVANADAIASELQRLGYKIVSGGTDNHLFLLDLTDKNITGKAVDLALGRANITVNRNAVPGDLRSPFVTSGIRIGSPASTRRGFRTDEMQQIAQWIHQIISHLDDDKVIADVRAAVRSLCRQYPVYPAC